MKTFRDYQIGLFLTHGTFYSNPCPKVVQGIVRVWVTRVCDHGIKYPNKGKACTQDIHSTASPRHLTTCPALKLQNLQNLYNKLPPNIFDLLCEEHSDLIEITPEQPAITWIASSHYLGVTFNRKCVNIM